MMKNNNEQEQLYDWIPKLYKEKKTCLSIKQLRLLHFILGYNINPDDGYEYFEEALLQYEFEEDVVNEIVALMKRDGFIVIREPYPIDL